MIPATTSRNHPTGALLADRSELGRMKAKVLDAVAALNNLETLPVIDRVTLRAVGIQFARMLDEARVARGGQPEA
ncbi:MAG: hypothetical protein ACE15C_20040 [Phycisphaerae bacterium]